MQIIITLKNKSHLLAILSLCLSLFGNAFAQSNIAVNVATPALFSNQAIVTVENKSNFSYVVKVIIRNASNPELDVGSVIATVEAKSISKLNVSPYPNLKFHNALQWTFNYNVGNFNKIINKNPYLFPLATDRRVVVCQSDDGPLSTHTKGEFAIDLCASIGTSIYSINDGVVFSIVDEFTEGGADPKYYNKANFIEILNDDGTRVLYTHLAPKSAKVKVGELVKRGQLIGEVGLTGFTSEAHLHLHISYIDSKFEKININPKFSNLNGDEYKLFYGNVMFEGVDFLSVIDKRIDQISVLGENLFFKKLKFGQKFYWVEVDKNNKLKFWFDELENSKSFYRLYDKNRKIGLLLPKNGDLIFLLNSDGDYVRPLYRVAINSLNSKQTDFQLSIEHSKGTFRGYLINGKMVWLETSLGASTNFRVFNEYERDSGSITLSSSNGDLLLKVIFKDQKMKFSRNKGVNWYQLYDVNILIND